MNDNLRFCSICIEIVYYTTSAEKVKSDLFARVLYNTFHNKGVKSASYFREKGTFHNSIVKNIIRFKTALAEASKNIIRNDVHCILYSQIPIQISEIPTTSVRSCSIDAKEKIEFQLYIYSSSIIALHQT